MSNDTIKQLLSDGAPVTVTGLTLLGYSLNTWIVFFTFIYVVLRLVFFLYDRYTLWKRKDSVHELES